MSMVPRVGTELAGYRIDSVLGRGGMAVVYLAEHLRLGRKVALKVMAPELADDDLFRERFISESRTAASLQDPNIIPIYDAGEAQGVLYIAMRLVAGAELKTLIANEGPLDLRRTASIIRQAANGLDAAHAAGLIHRDVKPSNILVTPPSGSYPEHVYITDFGLTKRAESKSGVTKTGQFVGSLDYLAPERIDGSQPPTPAVDVYALGCVLYECLTKRVPYPRDNDMASMWAHMNEAPPKVTAVRSDLPPALDEVVARALAKQPFVRYESCGELASAVEAALSTAISETAVAPGDPLETQLRTPAPDAGETIAAQRSYPTAPPPPVPSMTQPAVPSGVQPAMPSSGVQPVAPVSQSAIQPPPDAPPEVQPPAALPSDRPPREGGRRRPAWLAPVAALVVIALALGGFLLGRGTAKTTPGKGTPAASGGPTAVPAGSGCTDINGNTVQVGGKDIDSTSVTCLLAKHIPAQIRAGCEVLNGKDDAAKLPLAGKAQQPPAADIFLLCDHVSYAGDTFTVWYLFKHDRDEVGVDYQQLLTSNGISVNQNANQSSCATTTPIEKRWYVEQESLDPAGALTNVVHTFDTSKAIPFSKFYPTYGRFTCFQDGANDWLAWTDANLTVLTVAESQGGNWDKLQTWWALDAGPGHPPAV